MTRGGVRARNSGAWIHAVPVAAGEARRLRLRVRGRWGMPRRLLWSLLPVHDDGWLPRRARPEQALHLLRRRVGAGVECPAKEWGERQRSGKQRRWQRAKRCSGTAVLIAPPSVPAHPCEAGRLTTPDIK